MGLEFRVGEGSAGSGGGGDFGLGVAGLVKLKECRGGVDGCEHEHWFTEATEVSILNSHADQQEAQLLNFCELGKVVGRRFVSKVALLHDSHVGLVEIEWRHKVELEVEEPKKIFLTLQNSRLAEGIVGNLFGDDTRV